MLSLFIRQTALVGLSAVAFAFTTSVCTNPASAAKLLPEQQAEFFFDRGHKSLDAGKILLAERFYRKAIEFNPTENKYHRQLALCLVKMGRGQEAEREIAIAISSDPEDWRALLMRGQIEHMQKRYDTEINTYKRIMTLLPPDHAALKEKLEKYIADDEALKKKAAEIAKRKKEEDDKFYKY